MRKNNFATVSAMLMALVLLGASCGQKPPAATNDQATPSAKYSDTCGNPYYPFKQGLTIAYTVSPSTGAVGDSDYTLSIIKVAGTTATTRAVTATGASVDLEADCSSGSVALKGSSGLGAAMENVKFKTTVLSSSGTYMPANVSAGTTWENSETIRMEVTDGSSAALGPIELTTTEKSKAIGEESIKVQAGTYKAMKIEVTRTTTSKFSSTAGIKLPDMPPTISTSTEWWVKGIGMIKSETITDGEKSTTEAKSVTGN